MKKNHYVFVQALLFTIVVFVVGFYIGTNFEGNRMEQVNEYYIQSEVSLMDVLSLNNLIQLNGTSCSDMVDANYKLLDRVYEEAVLLDEYEASERLTGSVEAFHKKYDVLRMYLWINAIQLRRTCGDEFSTIVYLYAREESDLTKKAEQNVWSKLLGEIKEEKGKNLFLISIAVDSDLASLDSLTKEYEVTSYPAVIIDEKKVYQEIPEKGEILSLIK